MRRLLSTAAALALMTGAAAAQQSQHLVTSGYWSTYYIPANSGGAPMCMMRATWKGSDTTAVGQAFVKYSDGELFFHITKSNWRFPTGVEVPLSITFDRGVREAVGRTGRATGSVQGMIEIGVNKDAIKGVLWDFAESNAMTVEFKSGNEAPWVANMTGSRTAAYHFLRCIRYINGGEATSPVGPQATSPVDPKTLTEPKAVPTTPVRKGSAPKKDDGSI